MIKASQKQQKLSALKELLDSEMGQLLKEKLEIMKNTKEKWDGRKLKKIRESLGLKNEI